MHIEEELNDPIMIRNFKNTTKEIAIMNEYGKLPDHQLYRNLNPKFKKLYLEYLKREKKKEEECELIEREKNSICIANKREEARKNNLRKLLEILPMSKSYRVADIARLMKEKGMPLSLSAINCRLSELEKLGAIKIRRGVKPRQLKILKTSID